jgi:hypothetical protein
MAGILPKRLHYFCQPEALNTNKPFDRKKVRRGKKTGQRAACITCVQGMSFDVSTGKGKRKKTCAHNHRDEKVL